MSEAPNYLVSMDRKCGNSISTSVAGRFQASRWYSKLYVWGYITVSVTAVVILPLVHDYHRRVVNSNHSTTIHIASVSSSITLRKLNQNSLRIIVISIKATLVLRMDCFMDCISLLCSLHLLDIEEPDRYSSSDRLAGVANFAHRTCVV
ncbi:hypothetical protein BZA05DRAFT_416015 [Tricharina praecox]|uniref:uncharacterized protein n=1 Tax=Tricharina praecox TaxID=43433 RepID=UPI002220C868|nr:uncharacterized protein BZA05DRAFT_416015 [Tricharina praecox]KAI5856313.1 hypothetical protein BZA05DRAFT_416015 [Tricharina praecox]